MKEEDKAGETEEGAEMEEKRARSIPDPDKQGHSLLPISSISRIARGQWRLLLQ